MKSHGNADFVFAAFISYSHVDAAFASVLENALEKFRPPKGLGLHHEYLNVYRDEQDGTGTEYYKSVDEHLRASNKLLVICSPNAWASEYVGDEIQRFVSARGAENVIPVLVQGLPNSETQEHSRHEQAFPEALVENLESPLAVDFRGFDPEKDRIQKGRFIGPWYALLSNIFQVSRTEIEQRDERRRRRVRALIIGTTGAVIIALSIVSTIAFIQRNAAILRLEQARSTAETLHYSIQRLESLPGTAQVREQLLLGASTLRETLESKDRWSVETALASHMHHARLAKESGDLTSSEREYAAALNIADSLYQDDPKLYNTVAGLREEMAVVFGLAGDNQKAVEAVSRAIQTLQEVSITSPSNHEAKFQLSALLVNLGDLQTEFGQREKSLPAFEEALQMVQSVHLSNPLNPIFRRQMAVSLGRLGEYFSDQAKWQESVSFYDKAVKLSDELARESPANVDWQIGLRSMLHGLGRVHLERGAPEEALPLLKRSVDIAQEYVNSYRNDRHLESELRQSLLGLGDAYFGLRKFEEAQSSFEAAMKISEKRALDEPSDVLEKRWVEILLERLGDIHLKRQLWDDALKAYKRGLDIADELTRQDKGSVVPHRHMAVKMRRIGDVYMAKKEYRVAVSHYEDFLSKSEDVLRRDPNNTEAQNDVVSAHWLVADALFASGQRDVAIEQAERTCALLKSYARGDPGSPRWPPRLAEALVKVAYWYRVAVRPEGSIRALTEGRRFFEEMVSSELDSALWQRGLVQVLDEIGFLYKALGKTKEALNVFESARTLTISLVETGDAAQELLEYLPILELVLGSLYANRGDYRSAREAYERGYASARALGDGGSSEPLLRNMTALLRGMGDVGVAVQDFEYAIARYEEGCAIADPLIGKNASAEDLSLVSELHAKLGDGYVWQKLPRQALDEYRHAIALSRRLSRRNDAGLTGTWAVLVLRDKEGNVLQQLGNSDEAISAYRDAVDTAWPIWESLSVEEMDHGKHTFLLHLLAKIGDAYSKQGDSIKANRAYDRGSKAALRLAASYPMDTQWTEWANDFWGHKIESPIIE